MNRPDVLHLHDAPARRRRPPAARGPRGRPADGRRGVPAGQPATDPSGRLRDRRRDADVRRVRPSRCSSSPGRSAFVSGPSAGAAPRPPRDADDADRGHDPRGPPGDVAGAAPPRPHELARRAARRGAAERRDPGGDTAAHAVRSRPPVQPAPVRAGRRGRVAPRPRHPRRGRGLPGRGPAIGKEGVHAHGALAGAHVVPRPPGAEPPGDAASCRSSSRSGCRRRCGSCR